MSEKKRTYKTILAENPDIKRWHSNMSQGSEITADVNLRRLMAFCREIGITHNEIIQKKSKEVHNIFIDYVADKSKEINKKSGRPYAGSYIESTIKAVKSWLSFNDIEIKKVKVRRATDRPTLDNEIIPTQAELKRIFLSATMRDRVSCALLAHSGLRPESLGNYKGTDGLRVSDFPEMVIEGNTVKFEVQPTKVNIRPQLSKARHQYFTFLSEEGCEYLKTYLEYRIAQGETMTPDTDIISPKTHFKAFVTTIKIGDGVRNAIRKAGFRQRPYVLRSYFDTQFMVAESKGKIPNQYRMFFMGHVGNMEARYTTNKKRFPNEVIEDMREAYKRAQPFIQTEKQGPTEDQISRSTRRQVLMMMGFSADELDKIKPEEMSDEEVQKLIREKMTAAMFNNGNSQKVITETEVEKYLSEGWQYVDKMGSGKVIVRLPR